MMVQGSNGVPALISETGQVIREFPDAYFYSSDGAWTPDGGAFVYRTFETPTQYFTVGVAALPMNGGPPRLLLPGWSPLGAPVVLGTADRFTVLSIGIRENRRLVVRVRSDGTTPAVLWDPGESAARVTPLAISPDGERLVWRETSADLQGQRLWVGRLDGTGGSAVQNVPGSVASVVWSPDGRSLLVEAREGARSRLFRAALPSLRAVEVSDGRTGLKVLMPPVSPDGRHVLYETDEVRGGRPTVVVYRLDLERRSRTEVALGHISSPSWSPDVQELAYTPTPTTEQGEQLRVHSLVTGQTRTIEGLKSFPVWRPRLP